MGRTLVEWGSCERGGGFSILDDFIKWTAAAIRLVNDRCAYPSHVGSAQHPAMHESIRRFDSSTLTTSLRKNNDLTKFVLPPHPSPSPSSSSSPDNQSLSIPILPSLLRQTRSASHPPSLIATLSPPSRSDYRFRYKRQENSSRNYRRPVPSSSSFPRIPTLRCPYQRSYCVRSHPVPNASRKLTIR